MRTLYRRLSEEQFYIWIIVAILIVVAISIYYLYIAKITIIDVVSITGSFASILGIIVIIYQLGKIQSETEKLNKAYLDSYLKLKINQLIPKISEALTDVDFILERINEDRFVESKENIDSLSRLFQELEFSFEDLKIDISKIGSPNEHLKQCVIFQDKIFKNKGISKNEISSNDDHHHFKHMKTFLHRLNHEINRSVVTPQ